ncbi:hypothetical protein [Mangrovicoccus algicola]|uniref:Apea-like HEPN domain-containing protein n=1 Tax=Mangrovicoccus algicola TaxID=2771008 RepID=A0A8J6YVR4_9RHOB|nr:hypothetical protein [Mangrovicoccus algicola]MBE3640113.1 hypothetical protein [Mangrovicoccus algicola]
MSFIVKNFTFIDFNPKIGSNSVAHAKKGDAVAKVHYLIKDYLVGYGFNPQKPNGISFEDSVKGIRIEISEPSDRTEVPDHFVLNDGLQVKIYMTVDAKDSLVEFIENLINGIYLRSHSEVKIFPEYENGRIKISENGEISKGYPVRSDLLPRKVRKLTSSASFDMMVSATKLIKSLRWTSNATGSSKIFGENADGDPIVYWKTTQEHYHLAPLPPMPNISLKMRAGIAYDRDAISAAEIIWRQADVDEPLSHQLLRDAHDVKMSSKKSALMISYAALEVGVKSHISNVVPKSAWLATNAPSPPIDQIIRTYIPIIHSGRPEVENWSVLSAHFNQVKEFSKARNKLTHQGKELNFDIEKWLTLTKDLLYIFDFLEGKEWASGLISEQVIALLGWFSTRDSPENLWPKTIERARKKHLANPEQTKKIK